METPSSIWISTEETFKTVLLSFLGYIPSLVGAITIVIIGWLIARFVRAAAKRIVDGLNRVLERTFQTGTLASARLPSGASTIFGEAAFWVIVFVTLTISARIAQLPTISRWLNDIVLFLPDVLIGLATITLGYLISNIVGEQVSEAARGVKSPHDGLLGRVAKGTIFVIATIIGLDQIGVDVTFLVTVSGIAVGAILFGFSIAFGFGSREYVGNIISARSVRQSLSPGVMIRIGETEGAVLEITQTHIAIETEKGRAMVPAHLAEASGMVIISHNAGSAEAST